MDPRNLTNNTIQQCSEELNSCKKYLDKVKEEYETSKTLYNTCMKQKDEEICEPLHNDLELKKWLYNSAERYYDQKSKYCNSLKTISNLYENCTK